MIRFIDEKEMIDPQGLPTPDICGAEIAVTAFSTHLFDELLRRSGATQVAAIKGGVDIPLYICECGGKKIIVYKSMIGAPAASCGMEEVFACGIKKIVAFGICGALTKMPEQTIVVPARAYRDEGTSYHYLAPTEYIELAGSKTVKDFLDGAGMRTVIGGVWTTDGFYRETKTRAEEMRRNGCIAVDMECAALQAVANYRGKEFYTFFITADSLAGEQWAPNDIIDQKITDSSSAAVAAALQFARSL